jgi:hypothetical protein
LYFNELETLLSIFIIFLDVQNNLIDMFLSFSWPENARLSKNITNNLHIARHLALPEENWDGFPIPIGLPVRQSQDSFCYLS